MNYYDIIREGQLNACVEPGRVLAALPGFPVGRSEVYKRFPPQYDLLCLRQDRNLGNIASVVGEVLREAASPGDVRQLVVADIGTGTGKLADMIEKWGAHVIGFDRARPMLNYCHDTVHRATDVIQAMNAHIPLRNKSVDVAIAGWTLSETKSAHFDTEWRQHIDDSLAEVTRISRRAVLIMENLSVGQDAPARSGSHFYKYLVENAGFTRCWKRTDYVFDSVEEAIQLTRFFFGTKRASLWESSLRAQETEDSTDMETQEKHDKGIVLPECTGFFWKTL